MDFKDISPYSDHEVNGHIKNLLNNKSFFKQLAKFLFPTSSKILPGLVEMYIKSKFRASFESVVILENFNQP